MAKGKRQIDFIILWGLPACGKTTYAQTEANLSDLRTSIIYLDDHIKNGTDFDKLFPSLIHKAIIYTKNNRIIVDGLVTTNRYADYIMSKIDDYCSAVDVKPIFRLVLFRENRKACLQNDMIRNRKVKAQLSIENMPFEIPNEKLLKKFNINFTRITYRDTYVEEQYKVFAREVTGRDNKVLKSERWSLGGSYGSYNGKVTSISADPQPVSFKEFDELLFKVCPNISFLAYKKLYNETVKIQQDKEDDFYGGSETKAYYECDLKKLYEILREMEILK